MTTVRGKSAAAFAHVFGDLFDETKDSLRQSISGKLRPGSTAISRGGVYSKYIKTYHLDNTLRQSATQNCAKFIFSVFYILIM